MRKGSCQRRAGLHTRVRSLASPSQAKPRHGWHGMAWFLPRLQRRTSSGSGRRVGAGKNPALVRGRQMHAYQSHEARCTATHALVEKE